MKNLFLVLVLAFTLPFIGCRSNDQEKLIGIWDEIPFTNPAESTHETEWIFYSGDRLEVQTTAIESSEDSTVYKYTYAIDGSKLRVFNEIKEDTIASGPHGGEFWVQELGDEYMKITKEKSLSGDYAFERFEFVKQ